MTPDQRLQLRPGFEDLGETSFYPALMLTCLLLISPASSIPPLAVLFGAILLALSIQLAMRLPCLTLPAVFRDPIVNTKLFQHILGKHLSRQSDTPERKRYVHWAVLPPFDLVPRMLIGVTGLVAILGAGLPGLPMVMGLAALLITVSLMFRSVLALLFGAATLSLSSLIPILSS